MKFEEFYQGQVISAGPYQVDADEVIRFAGEYDPQWFHVDPQAASAGPFGGLIASGWHTCAISMRLVADAALKGSESFASPGIEQIRWPHPVRPGDELYLRATVIEVRRSRSRPELGILRWRWQLLNTDQLQVLDLTATSMFDLVKPAP
ncbi:acyl dehydratase [Xenophilus aerolatus]|nr:acyl dehydratase [Xenophilus aerolatus]